jgi:hypothetical protein
VSSLGWRVVHAIDERYRQGQRRGEVQLWERSRILAGDYSPIVRDLQPAMEKGSTHVLSWSRPTGSVDQQGEGLPKAPPEPLFWIVITRVVRHKNGTWRISFDIHDRREPRRLIRRKPPAMPFGDESEIDPELARVESAYTGNPKAAVDHLEAVDDDTLGKFTKEARVRLAENRKQMHAEEQAEDQARQLAKQLRDVTVGMVRDGADPTPFLAGVQRMVSGERERMKDAA